jgi:phosphoenolpyruvate carboxykinase (ATP)
MITAVLNDQLNNVAFEAHPVFGMQVPQQCPGVPDELLNPAATWNDKEAYNAAAQKLAKLFVQNFEQFADNVSSEILAAAPTI